MPDDKSPQPAECLDCGHKWTVAWIPMELTRFATLIGSAHCPSCGADSSRLVLGESQESEA